MQFIMYTNTLARAAETMDQQVARDAGAHSGRGRVSISTFHSWCARLVRRLGITVEVASGDDRRRMLGQALAEARKREYSSAARVRENPAEWWSDEITWIEGRLLPGGRQILVLAAPLLPAADAAAIQVHPSEGPAPVLYVCPDAAQEESVILHLTAAIARADPNKTVGLLARTWSELDRLKAALHQRHNVVAEPLLRRSGDALTPGVKLTTFYSAEGLEFDTVVLTHLDDGSIPLDPARYHAEMTPADEEEFLSFERKLLYVAMTRARHALAMTCSGTPSRFLQELDPAAYEIVDAKVTAAAPAQ